MSCRKYRPSNGTEGCMFIEEYCLNCIHGKYEHTQNHADNPCEILTRSFLYDLKDKEYPEEWTYDDEGFPICTAYRKFDWGRDDDGNLPLDPELPTDDPNQLCLPFIFDEINIPKTQPQLCHT